LGDSAVAGRLTVDELEARVGTALSARTRADLDRALRGVPPGRRVALPPVAHAGVFVGAAVVLIAVWEVEREAMGPGDSAFGYFWPFWILAAWLAAATLRHVRRRRPAPARRALTRG
jgi:Domain of unknown function (DUF1707)